MMKRIIFTLVLLATTVFSVLPQPAFAAGGISPSGGGTYTVGQSFTVKVVASGTTFESFQGYISVTGAVAVSSFSPGGAFWAPGSTPANNQTFAGGVSPTSSFTIATISLKGNKVGTAKVTVSSVQLVHNGSVVSTTGGTTNITINAAPTPPGSVAVTSSTHPDQSQSYDATTAELAWTAPSNGANGYSTLFNDTADSVPEAKISTTGTTASYSELKVGTHYFHIRANNKDGWSDTTHFKINIKPKTDDSLATPAITAIETTADYINDITAGTLTGLIIKGTGPIGYTIELAFTPSLNLDATKYPAPTTDEAGNWQLTVTDPVKAGFYSLTATGRKDAIVSAVSPTVNFEVSVAKGGSVNVIKDADTTANFKAAQAAEQTRVAAANSRQQKLVWGGLGGAVIIALVVILYGFRRRLFAGIKI